jgi:hypothetical protein
MIVVGTDGGENGEWCWLTRKEGSQILEKHRAMTACTGADSRL